jgi:hypothetical protein
MSGAALGCNLGEINPVFQAVENTREVVSPLPSTEVLNAARIESVFRRNQLVEPPAPPPGEHQGVLPNIQPVSMESAKADSSKNGSLGKIIAIAVFFFMFCLAFIGSMVANNPNIIILASIVVIVGFLALLANSQ